MLVTFSCDAHENITMFGDDAKRLLRMMGHSGTVPSAILAADIPEALTQLQKALANEKRQSGGDAYDESMDEDDDNITLSQRAYPLIELLKDAAKNECNVMWKER